MCYIREYGINMFFIFFTVKLIRVIIIFKKSQNKSTFHQKKLHRLKEQWNSMCAIQCTILFYIKVINTGFVYRYFIVIENCIKLHVKIFYLSSVRASGTIFTSPTAN
jgi:hypothetical protein